MCVCLSPPVAQYGTHVLYIKITVLSPTMMHIKKNPNENEDNLPSNSEGKSYWLVIFLHFIGSQEEEED